MNMLMALASLLLVGMGGFMLGWAYGLHSPIHLPRENSHWPDHLPRSNRDAPCFTEFKTVRTTRKNVKQPKGATTNRRTK
jgi:hypothetical protein